MDSFRSNRWRGLACVVAALMAAACSAEDIAARAEAGAERRAAQAATQLIAHWAEANDGCRNEPFTQASLKCADRDRLDRQLAEAGYCYGEGADYGYEAEWAICRSPGDDRRLERADRGLTPAEQEKADQIAAMYARDALVQAEVERQLSERRLADEQRARLALELVQ